MFYFLFLRMNWMCHNDGRMEQNMKRQNNMIWILYIFLFCVPLFLVLSIYISRTNTDSHDWSTETEKVDDSLKNRMQELACCPTTFYDSCEPTIIEKAYNEARLRGEKELIFNDFCCWKSTI